MNYHEHIIQEPQICGGAPVIRGTRVLLPTILAGLAEGASDGEILGSFPGTCEHLRAVIAFAAASAEEDLPWPGVPAI